MAKVKVEIYTFKVAGAHSFPIDMLRYDQAWPRDESESGLIADKLGDFGTPPSEGVTVVTLQSIHPPTPGRWSSFLWTVTEINGHRNHEILMRGRGVLR
tara:strand:+ start:642 stop:938 length:297 start_codon:yes stop_codon:yes gene_type:complete